MAEPQAPLTDRIALEKAYQYTPPPTPGDINNSPFKGLNTLLPTVDGQPTPSALSALENQVLSTSDRNGGKLIGGSIPRSLAEVTSARYNSFVPGNYNNEDAYAQGQGWTSKMMNGVGKGLLLTGTTFLQSTAGLVNGVARAIDDGRAASFYDNEFNRALDEFNKKMEDNLPNYYKDVEKNANWYSPSKLISANFFWDGIIKNMGFAAGAALSGGVFAQGLKSIPLTARLFSVGKAAETLAATEEGLLAANKAAETYGKVKSLSDKFLSSYNLLNPGGRAVVAGLSTTGEAGFEAFHNLNQFRDERIEEYKRLNNGREPIGEELDKINKEADNVGNSSFLLNTGLLTATNYIQFPKILGSSYKTEKGIINGLAKDINEISQDAAGNFIVKAPKNRILSTLNKVRPYTFSTSEGFEEGAQYAITVGTQDYYNKAYRGDAASFTESLSQGITQTLGTNEGMENVLIGGLSGALMLSRGKYQESSQRGKNTAEAIQTFNKWKLSDFTKETINSVNRGTVIQEEREAALKRGDILETKDLDQDYIINYLTPRIKYGRYDLVLSDINDYKTLATTDEGFAQLQAEGKVLPGDTKQQYLNRLSNLASTAENIKSIYQSLQLRYGNLQTKEGKPLYSPEVMDKMIYAATKVADYDKRIPELSTNLIANGVDTALTINGVTSGDATSFNESLAQIEKLDVNADIKEDLVRDLNDISELSLRRQKFLKEYDDIKKSPEQFKNIKTPTPSEENTVKVKTKDGEENLNVGEEYFLGKVVEYDKSGKEVYRFPRLTILGENPDGTIKIKDGQGVIRDVEKSVLEDYKLGKVSDTLTNKKAKFYMENANSIFEFNFGKGKKQKEEEAAVAKNQSLLQQFLGTHSKEEPVDHTPVSFQPEKKKDDNAVINGTIAVDDGKPHQKRANTFGINLPNLKNRNKLRALEVTAKTEKKAGIPGLIDHLISGTDIDKNTVVAVVFVQDEGNGDFSFVDEKGKVIKGDLLDKAIYQVRPTEKLTLNYGKGPETMFRNTTPKETEEELRKRYAANRAAILASDELQPLKEFSGSFGILEYEQESNSKGELVDNFGAENTVESTGLVTPDDLSEKQIVEVSTLNDPTPENGVSFKSALGRVLLRIPGVGMIKLNTSKLGKRRAESIFSTIHQIAKNVNEDPTNGAKKSEPLFSWLKTVIYWGVPKDLKTDKRKEPTYNNVWFEQVEDGTTRLFISGKGGNFIFTPSSLESNKESIILLLENMYHNVSNSELNKGLKKYKEIIGFDKEGNPEYETWENYQTYLLTSKNTPLTTPVLAVKGTDKQNRKGIYFVLQDNIESEVQKPAPKEEPKKVEGLQVYTSPEGKKLNYLVNENGDVILKPGLDLAEVMAKLKPVAIANNPNNTSDEVKASVIKSIQDRIKASITKEENPKRTIFGPKVEVKEEPKKEPIPTGNRKEEFDKINLEYGNSIKPTLPVLKLLTVNEIKKLSSSTEMVKVKKEQDELKKKYDVLEQLKNCLWTI